MVIVVSIRGKFGGWGGGVGGVLRSMPIILDSGTFWVSVENLQ